MVQDFVPYQLDPRYGDIVTRTYQPGPRQGKGVHSTFRRMVSLFLGCLCVSLLVCLIVGQLVLFVALAVCLAGWSVDGLANSFVAGAGMTGRRRRCQRMPSRRKTSAPSARVRPCVRVYKPIWDGICLFFVSSPGGKRSSQDKGPLVGEPVVQLFGVRVTVADVIGRDA